MNGSDIDSSIGFDAVPLGLSRIKPLDPPAPPGPADPPPHPVATTRITKARAFFSIIATLLAFLRTSFHERRACRKASDKGHSHDRDQRRSRCRFSAHKQRQEASGNSGPLIFTDRNGGPLRRSNYKRRSFKPLLLKANISSDVRFHDLRHTSATLMLGPALIRRSQANASTSTSTSRRTCSTK